MPTPGCVRNIQQNHAGFKACTDPYCESISFGLGVHCSKAVPPLNPDDPVGPQFDPNLNGPGKPGFCYCCCSCFGSNTPVEVTPGEFAPARDIIVNEPILTAGADLNWVPRAVEMASTWDTDDGIVPAVYFLRYSWDGDSVREVVVSPDHPFLVEDGTIVAVQDLTKLPLRLRRADGKLSDVIVLAQGSYVGGVTSIQMQGDFDGFDLTGHLLNTHGLVSGDFKVQVHYSSQSISAELVHDFGPEKETLPVGTPEYHEAFPDEKYSRFVNDPADWPEGFVPFTQATTAIPASAAKFLTDAQARDIGENAPMVSAGDTYRARSLLYLFGLCRGLYPDIDFMLDWSNALPNAYTWTEWGRRSVVFTGGLVRLVDIGRDGLAVVLSSLIAYRDPEVRCVGEADYSGISTVMHNIWDGNLFVTVVDPGIRQVAKVFSYISEQHAKPNLKDKCRQPGIACRLDCYSAALSMFGVPDCAKPKPAFFDLRDARATSNTTVQITFSRALNVATAEMTENYEFTPAIDVLSAKVSEQLPNLVALTVDELERATTYLVKVTNVVSDDDVPLNPSHNVGAFTTKK